MPYDSTVYRILIASPSDVDEEREVAARVIQDWNDLNSFNKKIVLLPVRWETHTSPTYGIRPQESINKQIVDECDLLLGFFWTKIGTPTGIDISGTIEEIKRVSKADKPVMLYFSKRGKDPSSIDLAQLTSLNNFKEEIYKAALVEHYNNIVEFRDKISRQLEMKIRELQDRKEPTKDIITFSFIDKETGSLSDDRQTINVKRIEAKDQDVQNVMNAHPKVSKNSWGFTNSLRAYLNVRNNIPIVLGLKNNTERIFHNVIFELNVNSSLDDMLTIENIGPYDYDSIYNRLDEFSLTKENEVSIRKLFKNNLTKVSPNTWELSSKPFSLLANKTQVLDTVLLLYPKASMDINFKITVFSENFLQPIETFCNVSVDVVKDYMTKKELNEIASEVEEPDDLPF